MVLMLRVFCTKISHLILYMNFVKVIIFIPIDIDYYGVYALCDRSIKLRLMLYLIHTMPIVKTTFNLFLRFL